MEINRRQRTPTPYTVGVSPYLDPFQPHISNVSLPEVVERLEREKAIIGRADLPTGCRLFAAHNGYPYVAGNNRMHFMTATQDMEMPNVASFVPVDLAAMVGISRNFLRQNPNPVTLARMFGFNSGPADCHENVLGTKGSHAQTWSNLHIHNIQFGVHDMQSEFDSFGNHEKTEYLRKARLKGAEPCAMLIEDLARSVVADAIAGANLAGQAAIVASNKNIIRGAVSVDITRINDLDLALLLQEQHRRYVAAHEEVMSIFVSDYQVGAGNIWSMNSQDERMRRIDPYMQKLANSGIYNEDELSGMRRNLGRTATMARSRHKLGMNPDSSFKVKTRIAWTGPTYSAAVTKDKNNREILVFRPTPFTNAGMMEAVGYAPQRLIDKIIPQDVYDANHIAAEKAFSMAARDVVGVRNLPVLQ